MATHTLTLGVDGSGVNRDIKIANTQVGVSLLDKELVATAETDFEVGFELDVSACKSFYLLSSQDVLFETNAIDATGGTAISLLAGIPYVWHVNAYDSFLFTDDIAVAYVTNASGETAQIDCVALYDASP
jgi:hypothetical protein